MQTLKKILLSTGLFFYISYLCFADHHLVPQHDGSEQSQLSQARRNCKQICNSSSISNPHYCKRSINNDCFDACVELEKRQEGSVNKQVGNWGHGFQPGIITNQSVLSAIENEYYGCIGSPQRFTNHKTLFYVLSESYCNQSLSEIMQNQELNKGKKLICPEGNAENSNCESYCKTNPDKVNFFIGHEKFQSNNNINWQNPSICQKAALYPIMKGGNLVGNPFYKDCFNEIKQGQAFQKIVQEANTASLDDTGKFRWEGKGEGCAKGQPCEDEIKKAIANARKVCTNLHLDMARCCHYPESCAGGVLGAALKAAATFKNIVGGIAEQCDMVRDHFAANRGINSSRHRLVCQKKFIAVRRVVRRKLPKWKVYLKNIVTTQKGTVPMMKINMLPVTVTFLIPI